MDDRFVAIERGPDLPALKERSFCVRLGVDDDTDIPALFAKARRMDPGRLVIGEMHAAEVREFFSLLADDPRVGGLATLRADTVQPRAWTPSSRPSAATPAYARELIARVKPGLRAHALATRRACRAWRRIWSVEGLADGELVLREVETAAPAASELVAET